MSIKLYDAWRMRAMPMSKFQAWIDSLRQELCLVANERILTEIARRSVYNFDLKAVFPNNKKIQDTSCSIVSSWIDVMSEYQETRKKGTQNLLVDVECELVFYFKGNYIYFICLTNQRKYADIISALPNVEDYSYWNNGDRPSSITPANWRRRANTWNKIFGCKPFKLGGLVFTLIGDFNLAIPDYNEIVKYFPSFEERIKSVATDAVWERYCATLAEPLNSADIFKKHRWLSSDKGEQAKTEMMEVIANILKEIVAPEDLK